MGKVIEVHDKRRSEYAIGDMVCLAALSNTIMLTFWEILSISTDYRDLRKSAFQEYAVASEFNAVRLSRNHVHEAASIGVAFVAATIALGVSIGLVFPKAGNESPLNLLEVAQSQNRNDVPEDVIDEVFNAIDLWNRPQNGDWIMIYGGNIALAFIPV